MTPEEQQKYDELEVRKTERHDKIQKLRQLSFEDTKNRNNETQSQIDKIEAEDKADEDKFRNSLS